MKYYILKTSISCLKINLKNNQHTKIDNVLKFENILILNVKTNKTKFVCPDKNLTLSNNNKIMKFNEWKKYLKFTYYIKI